MDLSKYKLRLTVRAMCIFEQLAQKSFFDCEAEDVGYMMYAALVANTDIVLTYRGFLQLMKDKKVEKWLEYSFSEISKYNEQFKGLKDEHKVETDESGNTSHAYVTRLAAMLIVNYGLSPDYVMDKMELWELNEYFKAAEEKHKVELVEQRLWTYLTIAPNINTKKISSPEKLLPFEWEKESKKEKAMRELEENKDKIIAFFKRQQEKEDGTVTDIHTGQSNLPGTTEEDERPLQD